MIEETASSVPMGYLRKTPLFLLLLCLSVCAHGETERSIKAAGFESKNFALYLDAAYIVPSAEQANLKVQRARVSILSVKNRDDEPRRMDFDCIDSQSVLKPYQNSPYGRGSEGMVIGMECSPDKAAFIFLIVDEMREKAGEWKASSSCGDEGTLNTRPVAFAASFGHQAFCMEDWSAVKAPDKRFKAEFDKRRARTAPSESRAR